MGTPLDFGKKILNLQPFSVLMGAELTFFETGKAEMELAIKEEHLQQHGFVHGGVLSYLADNTLTYVGGTVLGDCLTLEFKINYIKPAVGERLIAKGKLIGQGKTNAICQCEIFSRNGGEEKLCAVAQGTIQRKT